MIRIKIILGSTRPNRFGIQPATWLKGMADQYADKAQIELIDLAEMNLPLLDEPMPPSMGEPQHQHTKQWAKMIDEADGFVFITPEYNHSYSPVLKNAIDYLAKEWYNKPVSFVSYGSAAGGTRGVEHLRAAVAWLKMFDLSEQFMLPNYYENLDENGQFIFTERHQKSAEAMFESLIFWAGKMQAARAELAGSTT